MLYTIASNDDVAHLWTYWSFIDEANATLIKYETDGIIIFTVTISTNVQIPQQLFDDYEFIIVNIDWCCD